MGVATYSGNIALINNYILPTIGDTKLASINTHFMEKYYKDLLKMPAVKSTKNPDGVDAELLMKVLGNPEMTALLTSLAKTMKV